ncbi:hypothetical protein INS49_006259 [Diaporthe citri]|uniref:uncharacterized protein n=1 Tax=Diaporthe citri TaxID=83186 RepID=UPI001C800F91|nr:uncharacterized protein INS49_006259 [Diaporthe citri]KAG6364656.1 hypothetical protein INS49_006259 [Diaporthe citri]
MKRVTRTGAELRFISRAHLRVRPFHHASVVSSSPEKGGTSHQSFVNQGQASPQGSDGNKSALSEKKVESSSAAKKKTVAEMDEELRLKLEGMSGEGGAAGIEYEDNDFPADAARVARWQRNSTDWLYCCVGSEYGNDYSSACADGADPFTLASASLIYGVAALSSAEVIPSTASSTATSGASASPATATPAAASGTASSSGDTCSDSGAQIGAIGAGVGASLGVISIGALLWAFWERRQRLRATAAQIVTFPKPGYEAPDGYQYANPSTTTTISPHIYNTPTSVAHPHELGPNEQKVELPGSITTVGDSRG